MRLLVYNTESKIFQNLSTQDETQSAVPQNESTRPKTIHHTTGLTTAHRTRKSDHSRGVLPYMAYTGMCRLTGYGFWPLCPKQGM